MAATKGVRCPDCRKSHIWRVGFTVMKGGGKVLRLKCQDCGTTFNAPKPRKPKSKAKAE